MMDASHMPCWCLNKAIGFDVSCMQLGICFRPQWNNKVFREAWIAYVKEACLLPGAKQGKKRKAPDHWPKRHMICGGKIATMFRIMPLAAKNHVNLCLYYDLPLTQRNNCTVLGTATKYYTATWHALAQVLYCQRASISVTIINISEQQSKLFRTQYTRTGLSECRPVSKMNGHGCQGRCVWFEEKCTGKTL